MRWFVGTQAGVKLRLEALSNRRMDLFATIFRWFHAASMPIV